MTTVYLITQVLLYPTLCKCLHQQRLEEAIQSLLSSILDMEVSWLAEQITTFWGHLTTVPSVNFYIYSASSSHTHIRQPSQWTVCYDQLDSCYTRWGERTPHFTWDSLRASQRVRVFQLQLHGQRNSLGERESLWTEHSQHYWSWTESWVLCCHSSQYKWRRERIQ